MAARNNTVTSGDCTLGTPRIILKITQLFQVVERTLERHFCNFHCFLHNLVTSFRTWCQLQSYGYRQLLAPPLRGLASFHFLGLFSPYIHFHRMYTFHSPHLSFSSITTFHSTHSSTPQHTPPVSIFTFPLSSLLTHHVTQHRGRGSLRGVVGWKEGSRQILESCCGQ